MSNHAKAVVAGLTLLVSLVLAVSLAGASKGVLTTIGTTSGTPALGATFNIPRGVAVNDTSTVDANDGNVYVIDVNNHRVQRFDADGGFIGAWGYDVDQGGGTGFEICATAANCKAGVSGGAAGQLNTPQGIAINQSTGNLYVTDRQNFRISEFGPNGAFIRAWGWNVAAAGDPGDTDPVNQLEVCTTVCQTATAGSGDGQFGSTTTVYQLAVDQSNGNVLVADPQNRRIQVFDSSGAFLTKVGAAGSGNGQFGSNSPTRVSVDSTGLVYAVDNGNSRIQRFTYTAGPPTLAFESVFNPGGLISGSASPTEATVDPTVDHVYVSKQCNATLCPDLPASSERRIFEYDSAGTLIDTHAVGVNNTTNPGGIGINPSAGRLYVPTTSGNRVYVLDDIAAPALTTALGALDARSATFEGTVDPNGSETTYRFEYKRAADVVWTKTHAIDLSAGAGDDPVPVSHTQPGLEPNTDYEFRLVATKPFGNPGATSAPVAFRTDATAPVIEMAATTAAEDRAVLRSRIDPESSPTSFHYQWGPTDAYGNTTPETAIGAGDTWALAQQQITGLSSNTTYHYRLLAESDDGGIATGPDRTLTTGPGLAENRAYELVSPADKGGKNVMAAASRTRVAADGSALQFASPGAFGDAIGTSISVDYMARRSTDPDPGNQGWSTHSITPLMDPRPQFELLFQFDARYLGEMSDDLSAGVMFARTQLDPGAGANVANVANLFARRDLLAPGPGTYQLQSDAFAPTTAAGNYAPTFNGASADFDHVSFTAQLSLTADAPAQPPACTPDSPTQCRPHVYENVNGALRLAGLVPPGADTTCVGPACVAPIRSIAGVGANRNVYNPRTISADGSRIFFTVVDNPASSANTERDGNLYVRENGLSTTKINVSERTSPDTPQPARFRSASADGRYVFFTTLEQLTDDDTDTIVDLYRADIEAAAGNRLTRLSVDEDPRDPPGNVGSVLGASEDGSYVYFTALSQLVAGGPPRPADEVLVYAWHEGDVSFVGAITGLDTISNDSDNALLVLNEARVTPDGRHLVFVSRSQHALTGSEPGVVCNEVDGRPCQQLYVYRADANDGEGALACASCRPGGETAQWDATTMASFAMAGASPTLHLSTAISDDGRYVSFSSAERLLPADNNGVEDAYLYDTVKGELRLLSSGEDPGRSFFLEASPDGRDIFIATRERLTGWDVDGSYDIYDVRVDGGFPEPPTPPTACQGDACQPAPTLLNDPTPSSSGFSGPGSQAHRGLKPRKCPKGKRRVKARGGKIRCVKKQGAKRKNRAKHNRRASR